MEINKSTNNSVDTEYANFLKGISASPYYGLVLIFSPFAIPEKDRLKPENIKMIFYGLFSAVLYVVLFNYQAEIIYFAKLTREEEKIYFLIPIGIAFLFSYAHGGFATYFWQSVGLQNKNDLGKEPSWTPYN